MFVTIMDVTLISSCVDCYCSCAGDYCGSASDCYSCADGDFFFIIDGDDCGLCGAVLRL